MLLLLLKFVLLAILLECAFTKGGVVAIVVVVDSIDVGVVADAVAGAAGGGVVAPFFKRMDFVADAVVILMLFLTLLCEYVIVISLLSSLSLPKLFQSKLSFTQCARVLPQFSIFSLLSLSLSISISISILIKLLC